MTTRRRRRVRDDSNKTLGQITRRWMNRSSTGRVALAAWDVPKKVKRAVKKATRKRK